MPPPCAGMVEAWPHGLLDALPDGIWTVIHVRPRQDKLLAGELARRQVPGIQFLYRHVRVYPGKGTQISMLPLLPGYLFVPGGHELRERIFETGRVVRLLEVHHSAELRQEIGDLAALITRVPGPVMVRPEIQPGIRVQLTRGSLSGLFGVVSRRRGRCELVVNVHMLGTSVAVACAAEDVLVA